MLIQQHTLMSGCMALRTPSTMWREELQPTLALCKALCSASQQQNGILTRFDLLQPLILSCPTTINDAYCSRCHCHTYLTNSCKAISMCDAIRPLIVTGQGQTDCACVYRANEICCISVTLFYSI